ncbi:hypothetical protein RUM44_004747 [Polyplax serrata]|uniref:RRM domain-containing protein n=1 Tax=Polyplax serrata TaxID=468196 RepID=A0ABR1B3R4_POLSC
MQGFKVIDIKFTEDCLASHCLYVKPHNVREKIPQKPPNKTLFVVGIPPYCNESSIKELFSIFGKIKNVYLHKTPSVQIPETEEYKYFPKNDPIKGFKVGYVVFEKEMFLKNALSCDDTLILPNEAIVTGIQKWNKEYNECFPDKKEMEQEIKEFMEKYDLEKKKKEEQEKLLSEPQEDGWITVTRKGKKPGFARKESVAKHLMEKSEKQRKKKELTNFYTFQIKQSKMKNLISLRKKFEEDKRKIAAMREARRFKPF